MKMTKIWAKNWLRWTAFLFLTGALAGCLKTREELRGETTSKAVQEQNQSVAIAEPQAQAAKVPVYQQEEVDSQIRGLRGQVEDAANQITQINAAMDAEKNQRVQDKTDLNQRLLAYEDAIKKLQNEVAILNEQIKILDRPNAEMAPRVKSKSKKGMSTADHLFAEKKWKEAIVAYQSYRDKAHKGKKYAVATYKIGVCFQNLGMKKEAKAFYDEVIAKFPKSSEARHAKNRIKKL